MTVVSWLKDGVSALNSLSGRGHSGGAKTHLAQRRAMAHTVSCYTDLPERPREVSEPSAFSDLTSGCRFYCADRQDIQPCTKHRVSWPDVGSEPIAVEDFAKPDDRERLLGWRRHLLRSPDEASQALLASGVRRPYMDPVPARSTRQYKYFIKELSRRGLVRFRAADNGYFFVGIFFVVKKSGQLRMVFDTRVANCDFVPAASTRLPSVASFAGVEASGEVYGASADVSNAFYGMKMLDR